MTSHGFGWFVVLSVMSACSQSNSDAKNAAGGNAAIGGSSGSTSASSTLPSGGTTSTTSSATGGTSHTGGATPVVHNGGRPATSWQPTACGGSSTLGSIDPTQLYYGLAQSPRAFLLINVHVPVSGHIPSTDVDIAYTDVPAIEQFIGDDKSQPVILYCATDEMSTTAGTQIVADGYCNVSELTGGMNAWRDTGYIVDP